MADEERPLVHSKNLGELFDQYGITAPNRAEFQEIVKGIQQEIPVDDARHLVRPLTVPVAGYHVTNAAGGAGIHSGCEVWSTARSGCYITAIVPQNALVYMATDQAWVFVAGFATAPAFQPTDRQADLAAQVWAGTIAAASRPANRLFLPNGIYSAYCPFWLAPGQRLLIFNNTANASFACDVVVQEIP